MSNRLSTLNSLAYVGVEPFTPPQVIVSSSLPTESEFNYPLGTLWVLYPGLQIYILLGTGENIAEWGLLFTGSSGGSSNFVTDSGIATQIGSVINILGNANINTAGIGNTVTTSLSNGSNGQVLLGGGSNAAWKSLTSINNTISYDPGVNTLDIETSGALSVSFPTDAGTATPTGGVLDFNGDGQVQTSGSGNTITVAMNPNMVIPGTIDIQSLGEGVVQSTSTGLLFSSKGTNGQTLISSDTYAPAWANFTSEDGTVTIADNPNNINLEATGASTPSTYGFMYLQDSSGLPNKRLIVSGTYYTIGSSLVLTKIFDFGNNVYPGNGLGNGAYFKAPLTGYYYIKLSVNSATQFYNGFAIITPSRTYTISNYWLCPGQNIVASSVPNGQSGPVIQQYAIVSLNAGNQVTFQFIWGGSGRNAVMFTPDFTIAGFFIS